MAQTIRPNLSPREQAVLDLIPTGHGKAVGRRRLAQITGLNDRTLREVIYRLVVVHGLPIGSSTGPDGGGYFLIQDQEDLDVATRHLRPRAKAIFRRTQALERIAKNNFNRQITLAVAD